MKLFFTTLFVGLLAIVFSGCGSESSFTVQTSDQGVSIMDQGQPVLYYQRLPKATNGHEHRGHYVHPLFSLDGQVLTEDTPKDHLHHQGIFWAWHQTWIGDKRIGDAWEQKDFIWEVSSVDHQMMDKGILALKIKTLYKSPLWLDEHGEQKPFIQENSTILVHPANKNSRAIDFEISLIALEANVSIGGAENPKGYGGFSPRIKLPDGMVFTSGSDHQAVEPENTPIDCGSWVDISGPLENDGSISGMTIMVHPSSAGFPQKWILRRKRSMQNPVYPGQHRVLVQQEKPLVLSYRLLIHKGDAEAIDLDAAYKKFLVTTMKRVMD